MISEVRVSAIQSYEAAGTLDVPASHRGLRDLIVPHRTALTRFGSLAVILILWEALQQSGTVNTLFLSSPSQVAARIWQLFASGTIWPHLRTSANEAGVGFGLAVLIGIPLGVAMGRFSVLRDAIEPVVTILYASPSVAFLPLLTLWLGTGLWSKVFLIVIGAVAVLVMNTETGVSHVDADLVKMARSFSASEWRVLTTIALPASAPYVITGLRLAVGRVLIMVVVAEMWGSTSGIGNLIFQGAAMYEPTLAFAGVVILAATAVAFNSLFRALEHAVAGGAVTNTRTWS